MYSLLPRRRGCDTGGAVGVNDQQLLKLFMCRVLLLFLLLTKTLKLLSVILYIFQSLNNEFIFLE